MTWATKETNSEPNPDLTFVTKPAPEIKSGEGCTPVPSEPTPTAAAKIMEYADYYPKYTWGRTYETSELSELREEIARLRKDLRDMHDSLTRELRYASHPYPKYETIAFPASIYPTYGTTTALPTYPTGGSTKGCYVWDPV